VVASHGRALLASGDDVAMVFGDLRRPATILRHPDVAGLLDLSQPVAVLCTSTLHFIADEAEPHKIVAEYRDQLASGQLPGHHPRHRRGRTRGRAQGGGGRLPPGVVSAARQAAGGRPAVLRWPRARRAWVHLASRMAPWAGDRADRQAAFHPRGRRPQAL